MSDLAKFDLIEALARPERDDLIRARHAVHVSPDLQRLFDRADTEKWDLARLAGELEDGLFRVLDEEIGSEVARYLAEEFQARDKTKTLLVSSDTGLAVAEIPADAIYQPDPVAREGTDRLALPLPRIKPEIEAAIIQHQNTLAADSALTSKLQVRARSSALQRAEGDARLRIATRAGRKTLAEQLYKDLPTLLQDTRGASGRLLSRCRLNETAPETHSLTLDLTLYAHVTLLVADALANNLRHDAYGSAKDRIRSAWTRSLAKSIATLTHLDRSAQKVLTTDELPVGLLIGEANVISMVQCPEKLLAIDAPAVILAGNPYLTVEEDYEFDAREAEARWNLDASVSVKLHLDPGSVHPLVFTDVVESGTSIEVFP